MFVSTLLHFSYYGGLYFRGNCDNVRLILTLWISEFLVLANVQDLLFTAEGRAPDYFVWLLRFDDVGGDMSPRLLTTVWNIFSHSGFSTAADKMRMDPVFVAVSSHFVTEVD